MARSPLMIALKVVLTIVLVVVIIVMALRARKLLRDRANHQVPLRDTRLVLPPPSPYSISKGFRLLDGGVPLNERPQPPRPRLETSHEYVFSDAQLAAPYELSAEARHNSKWALERSTNRSRMPSASLWAVLLVALLLIGALVAGYLVLGHHPRAPAASSASGATITTTTATSTSATSSVARPATLSPVSSTAQGATYVIAATDYPVTVTTSAGPLKVIFRTLHSASTLSTSTSTLASGTSITRQMRGSSTVSLYPASRATVRVGTSVLTLPKPLSSTFEVTLQVSVKGSG